MNEEDEQPGGGGTPPPPPRKRAPETIRIQSSNPIPPGRVDFTPPTRAGWRDVDPRLIGAIAAAILIVVIAVGFFLTAGEDEEPQPAATPSPTVDAKDRFVARGDALCRRANRKGERLLYPDIPEQFPTYLDEVRTLAVELIDDLKKLRRPKEDRKLSNRLFAKLDRLPPLLTQAQNAAAAGDLAEVDALLTRAEKIEHQANAVALQYGFVDCSQP